MLKNLATVQHIIGDNVYRFECDSNAPIPEVKEALSQFMKYVGNLEDAAKAKAAEQAASESAQEQPKEEANGDQ